MAKFERNSASRVPLGEKKAMHCSRAEDCFFVVTPWRCTSGGSWDMAVFTRLVTFTVFRSGSEPTSKLTVRL